MLSVPVTSTEMNTLPIQVESGRDGHLVGMEAFNTVQACGLGFITLNTPDEEHSLGATYLRQFKCFHYPSEQKSVKISVYI